MGRVEVESEVSLRERLMRLRGLVSSRLGKVNTKVAKTASLSETHVLGWSMGWSVTTRASKASPASSMALTRSGVRSVSVTSALSLMTVVQTGSLAWSRVVVSDRS